MLSKDEYLVEIKRLGFVKYPVARTDGSHIRFFHPKYSNLFIGIDDHKNTKEMSLSIHKEIIKTMALFIWFEAHDESGDVDFTKVNKISRKMNEELVKDILKLLKKVNKNDISPILPLRLQNEIVKIYDDVSSETVSDYLN